MYVINIRRYYIIINRYYMELRANISKKLKYPYEFLELNKTCMQQCQFMNLYIILFFQVYQ